MTLDEEVHGRCKQDHRTDGTEDLAAAAAQSNEYFGDVFAQSWPLKHGKTRLEDNDQRSNIIFFGVTYFRTDPPYTLGVTGFSGQGKKNKGWP